MKTENGSSGRRSSPDLKAISARIGLFLILFNLVNGAIMGFSAIADRADSEWQICHAVAPDDTSRKQDHPAHPGSDDDSGCCLLLCCGVATTRDATVTPAPLAMGQPLSFDSAQSPQSRPAPSLGGIARAPPTAV